MARRPDNGPGGVVAEATALSETRERSSDARYRTIVADPPWEVGDFPVWFDKHRRSAREKALGVNPTPYETMALDDISTLPVGNMAAQAAHLYLWTTASFLESAYRVARAWGFDPQYPLAWCKAPMGGGLGGKFASNMEFILFCRYRQVTVMGKLLRERREAVGITSKALCAAIGAHGAVNHGGAVSNWENGLGRPTWDQWQRLKALLDLGDDFDGEMSDEHAERSHTRWFTWPRGKHSVKPEAFYDLVETVSPGPYVELFARRARMGWDCWGNEVDSTVELSA